MAISRLAAVSSALIVAAAIGALPMEVAGAQTPPDTFVGIPSNNATVSGASQLLDAGASSGANKVQFEITGGTLTNQVVAIATPTYYGWLAKWNTTTVANGSYSLESVASFSGGGSATSAPVAIVVNNAPPSVVVIVPTTGADVGNDDQPILLDALASPGVTSVSISTDIDGAMNTAVPTIYGWIAYTQPRNLCSAGCNTGSLPLTVYAVASYPNGVSGTSPTVDATYEETIPGGGF